MPPLQQQFHRPLGDAGGQRQTIAVETKREADLRQSWQAPDQRQTIGAEAHDAGPTAGDRHADFGEVPLAVGVDLRLDGGGGAVFAGVVFLVAVSGAAAAEQEAPVVGLAKIPVAIIGVAAGFQQRLFQRFGDRALGADGDDFAAKVGVQQRRVAIHTEQDMARADAVTAAVNEGRIARRRFHLVNRIVLQQSGVALFEDGLQQCQGVDGGVLAAFEGGVVSALEGVARVVDVLDAGGGQGAGGPLDIARFRRGLRQEEGAAGRDGGVTFGPAAPMLMGAQGERPELAHGGFAIAFAGAVVIGVDAAEEEAGVAAAGTEAEAACVGEGNLVAGCRSEDGGAAAGETGADDEEIGFVEWRLGVCLPVGDGHGWQLRYAVRHKLFDKTLYPVAVITAEV